MQISVNPARPRSRRLTVGRRRDRQGIAAVELAVCLPVLVAIILGTMQACSMIYLKQTLAISAYEGARASVRMKTSSNDIHMAASRILQSRNVRGAVVQILPTNFATMDPENFITVRITAPKSQNSLFPGWLLSDGQVVAEVAMMKEY